MVTTDLIFNLIGRNAKSDRFLDFFPLQDQITTNWGLTPPAWGDTFVIKKVLSQQSAVGSKIANFNTQDHENKTFTFSISSYHFSSFLWTGMDENLSIPGHKPDGWRSSWE
jgi:hypothetical protein